MTLPTMVLTATAPPPAKPPELPLLLAATLTAAEADVAVIAAVWSAVMLMLPSLAVSEVAVAVSAAL